MRKGVTIRSGRESRHRRERKPVAIQMPPRQTLPQASSQLTDFVWGTSMAPDRNKMYGYHIPAELIRDGGEAGSHEHGWRSTPSPATIFRVWPNASREGKNTDHAVAINLGRSTPDVCWAPDGKRLAVNAINLSASSAWIGIVDIERQSFRKLPVVVQTLPRLAPPEEVLKPPNRGQPEFEGWFLRICDWR